MSRLWNRGNAIDEAVLRLTVDRDPELDLEILPWDCLASTAHATMLASIGILDADELEAIRTELEAIREEALAGRFTIRADDEDGHTAIENRLTERLGEAGRKIHAGRSRNDQVLAALRLWGRQVVVEQVAGVLAVVESLIGLAEEHAETTVPGYTHTRQAMPTTLGHHFAAWAENLLDDLAWLWTAFGHLNRSPLGSASGFGVGLPLDRQMVSDLLGFERPQENTLAVQNDRGKSEYLALGAAAATATDLARLAADLIRYSSEELSFVRLSTEVTTGSSIMPQKRNPDVLELVRAGAARTRSRQAEVGAIYGGLSAGYHRDLQLTKEPFLAGMRSLVDMLTAMGHVLDSLEVDAERCREALEPSTGATDVVIERVREGAPFRDAYREAAAASEETSADDGRAEAWRARTHLGAPGDPSLASLRSRCRRESERLARVRQSLPTTSPRGSNG